MAYRDIDAAILEMVMKRRQKTAIIIMKPDEVLRKAGVKASYQEIAERIELSDAQGNIAYLSDLSLGLTAKFASRRQELRPDPRPAVQPALVPLPPAAA